MKPSPDPAASTSAGRDASPAKAAQPFIVFLCPNCGKRIGFPAQLAGVIAACSACKVRLMVPSKTGEESFVVCEGQNPKPPAQAFPAIPARRAIPEQKARLGSPQPRTNVLAVVAACIALAGVAIPLWIASRGKPVAERGGNGGAFATPASSRDAPTPAHPEPDVQAGVAAAKTTEPRKAPVPASIAADPPAAAAPASPKVAVEMAQAALPASSGEPATASSQAAPPLPTPAELFSRPVPRSPAARSAGDDEPAPAEVKKSAAQAAGGDPVAKAQEPTSELAEKASATLLIAPRIAEAKPRCPQCLGTGYVPILPGRAYTHFAKDALPNPVEAVPWAYCPRCQAGASPALLTQAEAQRLRDDKAKANQQNYEQATRLKFLRAETQHITLYMQLAEPFQRDAAAKPNDPRNSDRRHLEDRTHTELKEVAAALEQLKIHLEQSTRTTVLTQPRPDSHEMLILWDIASYNIAIDGLLPQSSTDDKVLARKAAGVSGRFRAFYNSYLGEPAVPRPPRHMALFLFGHMLMQEAADSKAPPWLLEGFGAYCEHAITKQNLCYSFEYEMNEIRFGTNWDLDIRRFARESRLKQWRQTVSLDLIGAKPLDYLSFYSIVSFLMADPPRFAQLVLEFKSGADSATALERSYGRKLEDLQTMWGNWLLR